MQAKPGVIDHLNSILTNELTAINQYFIQSRMCANWGYQRIAHKLRELSMAEMRDADETINQILFLDGIPNLQRLGRVRVGENVLEHLQVTLDLEREQTAALTEAIRHCAEVSDFATRGMLESDLRSEQEHIDWLETQLETISQIGLERYLAQQLHE